MNRALLVKIFRPFRNRYVLVVTLFALWMLFFDAYNLPSQGRVNKRIQRLEQRRDWYVQEIDHLREEHKRLLQNPRELERVARERYYLQKPNEDVFVITRPE
ncbi:MAG: septum formation initiator family protein [Bacteroidetes bacterium]|nr:septum formation initiator family protein [Bacteroidota bacterium]